MNPSQRLKPIKKLADNKEKEAAQSLGRSVEAKKIQLSKLQQLLDYRAEYLANMNDQTVQGISGAKLHQYHHFLAKLDQAIQQQKLVVNQSESTLSESQTLWKSDSSRANAIGKAINNMKEKEVKASDKRESAQADEMSTQAFLRKKNN